PSVPRMRPATLRFHALIQPIPSNNPRRKGPPRRAPDGPLLAVIHPNKTRAAIRETRGRRPESQEGVVMHRALDRLLKTSLVLALGVVAGVVFSPSHALANVAPVLTVPGPQTVDEGALLSFTISATDADGQPVVLRASALPAGSVFRDLHDNTGAF